MGQRRPRTPVGEVRAEAFVVPTDKPEADGTLAWNSTTLVVVEIEAAGKTGLGYTYAHACIVPLIRSTLTEAIAGREAFDTPGAWLAMQRAIRNLGREGLVANAISAVDVALWDLKAKLLGVALIDLLGALRDSVPIYGSGGFTNYSDAQLAKQLAGWIERDGCAWVKMKIGSDPPGDPRRVAAARNAIGGAGLFVDANGAYGVNQALDLAQGFAADGVAWFEEPVSSDDLTGLARLRGRLPPAMDLAAGEYAYTADYARRMLEARAVDVLQADATRCGGFTGFMAIAGLCEAYHTPLSGHCAPALHLHVACAAPRLRHLEWFHDHVRIEHALFDGAPKPVGGAIHPDRSRLGLGLDFRRVDAAAFHVS